MLGLVRVALVMITFVLISLGFYMERQSDIELSTTKEALRKAGIANEELEAKTEAFQAIDGRFQQVQRRRDSIISLVEEMVEFRLRSNVLESLLSQVGFIPTEQFTIEFTELDHERQHYVAGIIDKRADVNKGDRIDWQIDCETPLSLNAATGCFDGFGTFQAYDYRVSMYKPTGQKILEGTRSNDGQFLFRTTCRKVHIALKEKQCNVNVTISTPPLEKVYEEVAKRKSETETLYLPPAALRACKAYELLSDSLHSEGSCEREVVRLLKYRF